VRTYLCRIVLTKLKQVNKACDNSTIYSHNSSRKKMFTNLVLDILVSLQRLNMKFYLETAYTLVDSDELDTLEARVQERADGYPYLYDVECPVDLMEAMEDWEYAELICAISERNTDLAETIDRILSKQRRQQELSAIRK